jgi:ABC-type multidrug transport system fused ATPase/permease subunit
LARSDILAESAAGDGARWSLAREMRAFLPLLSPHAWAAPALLVLGLAASLAESVGVSLVVLLLYALIGHGAEAAQGTGLLAGIFGRVEALAGGSSVIVAGLILALVTAKALLNLTYGMIASSVRNRVSEAVRNGIHDQYLSVAYSYVRRHEQGELLNVLATESWAVADACFCLMRIAINSCAIAVFGLFLVALSWQIALIAAIGSGLLYLGLRRLSRPARDLGEQATRVNRALAERMLATLQGMRTIRAFAQEEAERQRFRAASHAVRRAFVRLELLYGVTNPVAEIGNLILLALIAASSVPLGIPFASTLAAVALLYRLQPHVHELEGNLLRLAGLDASLRVVRSVLSRSDKTYPRDGTRPVTGLAGDIRFDRVTLSHEGAPRPSLDQASFTIPRRAITAIIGPSGAGKTTIVNLLLRLYDPERGAILVGGRPLAELSRAGWLGRIAVAGQDVELIEGTIADNICLARPSADQDAMQRAAALAGIRDFVLGLPEGFDSWVGERGLNLSGGQRQRIGLARALICDPDLLILDEATNALDSALEQTVRDGLRDALAGRTLVVITHRLSALGGVDHLICLDEGRVVAEGPARLPSGPEGPAAAERPAPAGPAATTSLPSGVRS